MSGIPTAPLALRTYQYLGATYTKGGYGGFVTDDATTGYFTAAVVTAMCKPMEATYAAFLDGAWNRAADAPDEFVESLSTTLGVDTRGADLATQRDWIPTGGPTRQRGGDEAIVLRVKQVLTGTKEVRIFPRTDPAAPGVDSKWNTLIRTRASETPGGTASVLAAARDRAAAVWQMVHVQVLTGDAIDELSGPISGLTGDIEDL